MSSSSGYSNAEFWDKRYKSTDIIFDWYVEYPQLKYSFDNLYPFHKKSSILMVGCGNSNLSEQMYDVGFTNITNIDISPTVIEQMQKTTNEKGKHMKWIVMDATKTDFKNQQFDIVIDKGTVDALICGSDLDLSDALLKEMGRVVKKDGKIFVITHSGPEGRKRVFQYALQFDEYDYFFSKIYLSSSNIMINLMKANKNKMKEETDKQVLAKSMLEYSLLMMKKKKIKPEKFQVLWSQFGCKKSQIQDKNVEEQNSGEKKVQKTEQQTNSNIENQEIQKKPEDQQPTKNAQTKVVFKKAGQINPKQPYCFIFCISRKPYLDLCQTINIPNLNTGIELSSIKGVQSCEGKIIVNGQKKETILIQTSHLSSSLAAIKYLQTLNYKLPKIVINSSSAKIILNQEEQLLSFKYELSNDINRSSFLMSMRSQLNFNITLPKSNPIGLSFQQLAIIKILMNECLGIIQNNPKYCIDPDKYQRIADLSNKGGQSINSIIKSIWKPDVIVQSFKMQRQNIVILGKLCLPPVSQMQDFRSLQTQIQGFKVIDFNEGYFNKGTSQILLAISSMCRSHAEITIQKLWLSYFQKEFKDSHHSFQGVFHLSQKVATYAIVNILKKYAEMIVQ